jgi:hypothetical protein
MIWLTWRQFRAQAVVVLGVLVAIAITLAVTGPHLVHLYDTTVAGCAQLNDCAEVKAAFLKNDTLLQDLSSVVLVMPALIGIFWGAPLVARELENSTAKLGWTQSVSRTRWLVTKLVLVGLASVAVAGLLSLMVTWWSSPFDRITNSPFSPSFFDRRDIVPIAYAAFAFALGVTAGVLIRRTLPAMAASLVAFIGVRFAVFAWIRPRLMAPITTTTAFNANPGNGPGPAPPGFINPADWILSDNTINRAGQVIGQNGGIGPNGSLGFHVGGDGTLTLAGVGACPNKAPVPSLDGGVRGFGPPSHAFTSAVQECVNRLGLREVLRYQPVSRYWAFQWYETAIFVGLAGVLIGFCLWWVRRRLS